MKVFFKGFANILVHISVGYKQNSFVESIFFIVNVLYKNAYTNNF